VHEYLTKDLIKEIMIFKVHGKGHQSLAQAILKDGTSKQILISNIDNFLENIEQI